MTVNKEMIIKTSEDSEDSRNLLEQQGQKSTWTSEAMDIDLCDQCLTKTSKSREYSANLRMKADTLEVVQEEVGTLKKCSGKYSKSLRNLSSCVSKNVSVPKFSWFKSMSQIVDLTAAWHQDEVEANTASSTKTNITSVHSNFFL